MKKQFFIRNWCLGVLMVLVLAFSAQDIADAIDTNSFDLSATGQSDLDRLGIGTTVTLTITQTVNIPTVAESVNISISGGGATISLDGAAGRNSHTFTEDAVDGTLTIGTLTFRAQSAGKVNIRLRDTTSSIPSGSQRASEQVLTFYVVQSIVPQTASIRLAGISSGIKSGYVGFGTQLLYNGDGSHYPITYTWTGGGTAYIQEGNRTTTPVVSPLSTSSAAKVYLSERNSSTTVTAQVTGGASFVGAYVYGRPTLQTPTTTLTSDSAGVPGNRPANAFTAIVNDGAPSPAAVIGVPVKFEVKDKSTSSGGWLIPGAGNIIVDSSNRVIENPPKSAKTLYVRTGDAGAQIGYEVGTAGREQVVIVSAVGQTKEVTAYSTALPDREITIHTNARRSGSSTKYDLQLLIEDDGTPVSGVVVTFNTLKGTLTNTPDTGTSTTVTNGSVTENTNSDGIAHVIYDSLTYAAPLEVLTFAHKSALTAPTDEADRIRLTINVSGGSVTPPRDQQQQQQQQTVVRDAVTFNLGTSITGNAGDEVNLEARVTDQDGFGVQGQEVTFTLSDTNTGSVSPASRFTNSNGVAQTTLTLPDDDATITATATGYTTAQASITITPAPSDLQVASGSGQMDTPGSTLSSPFVVRFEDTEGDPISGAEITFTVETGGGSVSSSTDTTDSDGEAETTLTLGSVGMQNTVRASVDSTDYPGVASVTFTASAERPAEAVVIDGGNEQTGQVNRRLDEDLSVQVVDSNDNGIGGILVRFRITEGRGRLSRNSARTDPDGYAEVSFTPTADGETIVEAYSTGLSSAFFTVFTGEPPTDILKVSGDNQSGRQGAQLANPLVVEIVDENDDPVSGVTVNFAVTAGGGSVSPESATTNGNGRAQTRLTLGDAVGENKVAARVSGLTAVNFTATSGSQVLVRAAQRPPMYWIGRANGTLHRLVGEEVENLAPNVTGVTGIAVDTTNNLLYFSVQTGANRGQIQRSNLNGRNIQTLKTLTAVPRGIAVDSAGGIVYWTNSRGRIQSVAAEGSAQLNNLHQNLPNPSAIIISNGFLYWAEPLGRIRRVSLTAAQRTIQNIATGLGEPLSLSIAKGKIYWVERDAGGGGSLQRSNLDGSGIQELKTFASGAPVALAVDSSSNRIYWTKGAGKIQRANLAGKFVKDIATGIMNPGDITLGIAAVASTPRQPANNQQENNQQENNQETTYSQYDINQDGAVNNADTKIVSRVISGVATNARADVDGSGTVDVTDLILVIANLDDDVAAPSIDVNVKALDVDFDRVQEQVEVLLASGDRSIAAQRALLYLQHLLASARPDETVLLANYPNPFNPETWIPYHLAESTDVRVNIYDAQGVLVRVLTLGHQTAGYYTSRSRAAYWDGRNALGERVASGIYFYQLQTDEMSPLRKMVILK